MQKKIIKLLHNTKLKSRISFCMVLSFFQDLDTVRAFMTSIHPLGSAWYEKYVDVRKESFFKNQNPSVALRNIEIFKGFNPNSLDIDFLKEKTVPFSIYAKLALTLSDYEGLDVAFLREEFPGNKIIDSIIKKHQKK